ncbi:hypothetical protein HWV62_16036 [Athelia sp. TMB]|nr:hypothetical protein HWV62_16036 [Athelia sp. TMB]
MESEQPSTAAEQRAFAVARLKRAASLPRMKDGRRPPMHVEGVSEGEKTPAEGSGGPSPSVSEPKSSPPLPEPQENAPKEEEQVEANGTAEAADAQEASENTVVLDDTREEMSTPDPSRTKRRSRSRSRSRGSRDFKAKARATQSPTPSPLVNGNDSSPEESPARTPQITLPSAPQLVQPTPHFGELPTSRLLLSPRLMTPDHPLLYPGMSPPPSAPMTPMLPTLEALQKGLFRSNSAAARMMAMQKLTGGADVYDQVTPASTPPPLPNGMGRSNTVTGGERSAARQFLLRRLGERIKEEPVVEQTSGGEEVTAPPPPASPKRRRRRSRRGSVGASTAAEELESNNTGTDTQLIPVAPSPFTIDQLLAKAEPVPRPPSTKPSRTTSAQEHFLQRETALAKLNGGMQSPSYETPRKRRSVVVEDEDDNSENLDTRLPQFNLPMLPDRLAYMSARTPHVSDAPSAGSMESTSGVPVPIYLSATSFSGQQSSPQNTFPKDEESFRDEDEEQVLYQADNHRAKSPFHDAYDREISWIAEPVPETRIPIQDDTEEDEEGEEDPEEPEHRASTPSRQADRSSQSYEEDSQGDSSTYKELVIETETSPERDASNVPPSPSSMAALSNTASLIQTNDSESPQVYPTRLSVASRIQSDRSPLNTDFEWDDIRGPPVDTQKRGESSSTWEKVKSTFSRGPGGRRSRTNSLSKRDNTDSSVSRESGASLGSSKTDKGEAVVYPSTQVPHQLPSASGSVLSLSPHPATRSGASPIPPASSADLAKYQDSKLFPFPGMKKLEEQRNRARGMSLSSSTPDILLAHNGEDAVPQYPLAGTPDKMRERKLSHQASDSHLGRYKNVVAGVTAPPLSANPSASSNTDYFDLNPRSSPTLKLPTNREGVRRWLSNKKIFSSQMTSPTASTSSSNPSPPALNHSPSSYKKPSLADVLLGRKDNEWATDWEEIDSEKSRTPTSATSPNGSSVAAFDHKTQPAISHAVTGRSRAQSDTERTPKARKLVPYFNATSPQPYTAPLSPDLPSPAEAPSSATPDPLSSISDYPARSTSDSSSNTSSQYSGYHPYANGQVPYQGSVVLQRLDEMLGRGPRSPMWASAIDDPPRKLLLSSPVLQVASANTVKDRFLFLFNDIIVIAKPIVHDRDSFMDGSKPNPMDRKFIVKSVVLLRNLRFSADREETRKRSDTVSTPRNPTLRTFILQFARDPDVAVSTLMDKTGRRDDAAVGRLLFQTLELDRAQLGDYLSRRTSRASLKFYVDSFGFTGVRVDRALRVFLTSIHIPQKTNHGSSYSPFDSLLDSFAGRWYEANAGIVAYDKDLAYRLVRAVVQLNEVLHGEIAVEAGPTNYPSRNVTLRDFVDAFRRYDKAGLASDDLLSSIYDSIRHERLSQARNPTAGGPAEISITVKRSPPTRLTYRIQSEPIMLRIPQADPNLTIQLYGQGLTFDPPVLNFAKSPEASFRITGTALGPKTMVMSRSGPNAILYTGLPQSCSLVVERAFMRNTFNLAFANHGGVKRRYMFSVDDPLIRHQWAVSLKRQVDVATAAATSSSPASIGTSKFHRAAERTAFRILQETLIGSPASASEQVHSSIDKAFGRLASSPRNPYNQNGQSKFAQEQRSALSGRNGIAEMHARSKSRSQFYHKQAGTLEAEMDESANSSFDSFDGRIGNGDEDANVNGRMWSAHDLEMHCQQNSSIALVLSSFLQVGSPDHDHGLA